MRICLDKLVSFKSENHLKYVRDYAEFLYKHDIDIGYANVLTKEYTETSGSNEDHWTPYLNAHKLAKQGQLENGIESFDYWMTKYSKPENFKDDYWHYKFYIDLILYYKVASKQAIMYSEMFERNNPNIENTKQLAELYFYNGQIDEAVDKIKELVVMVEDPKRKRNTIRLLRNTLRNNNLLAITGRYMSLAFRTARTFWLKRTVKWSAVRPAPAPAGDPLLVSRFLPTRE